MTRRTKEKLEKIVIPTPFTVGDVNIYLLKGDAVSLIDLGPNTEEAWNALKHGLQEFGLGIQDIDQVFLTHHHVDHYGLASKFQEAGRAKIYCHSMGMPYISMDETEMNRDVAFFHQFYLQHGAPEELARKSKGIKKMYDHYGSAPKISGWLNEGDQLPGHEDWNIYHMPGHSQDHLCFYHPLEKTMLAGDHLIKHISSNAILEAPREGQERAKTLLQYRLSMKKCLELDIKLAHSGHGEPITEIRELIEQRFERQEQRAGMILSEIKQEPQTAFSIAQSLFGNRLNREVILIMSEIIGHLDWLEEIGWVEQHAEGQHIYYRYARKRN